MNTKANRKVFISFLGATNYKYCQYVINGKKSRSLRFVQEAMLEYYAGNGWTSDDCAYLLLTEVAKARNWENDGQKDDDGNVIKQEGLRDCLAKLDLPMNLDPIENVPMGNDETEIMAIFTLIFNLLKDGDELYFDITHGFRYLPIIALVLGNYSKFLKNVKVKWIGYGNYEGRDSNNVAQIVDLTTMSLLQDWTTAAADFINNGNAAKMLKLTAEQDNEQAEDMAESLCAVVDDIKTCRGMNIHQATNVKELNTRLDNLADSNNEITLLTPLLAKIKQSIEGFDVENENNIGNGLEAARWCINNNMSQQAATILQETMITHLCMRSNLEIIKIYKRDLVSKAINIKLRNIKEEDWRITGGEKEREGIKCLLENEPLIKNETFLQVFKGLTELRNDLNHCGMREETVASNDIKDQLQNYYNELSSIIINDNLRK